jgi:cation:H+ antiporter
MASITAAELGSSEIAQANAIGSNIFNVGAVLGCAGLLRPFPVDPAATGALMLMTLLSAVWLLLSLRLQDGVTRRTGGAFLVGYAGYLAWEERRPGAR